MAVLSKVNYDLMVGKRKHTSQLSDFEANKIWYKIDKVKNWRLTYHAQQRISEREMLHVLDKIKDLNKIINNSKLIEYGISHKTASGVYVEKVLLRTTTTIDKKNNLIIALDITNGLIKSLWLNNPKDNHRSLNMNIYDDFVQVVV